MPLPLPGKCERETKTENADIKDQQNGEREQGRTQDGGRRDDENDPLRSKTMRHSQTVCKTSNAVVSYNLE